MFLFFAKSLKIWITRHTLCDTEKNILPLQPALHIHCVDIILIDIKLRPARK